MGFPFGLNNDLLWAYYKNFYWKSYNYYPNQKNGSQYVSIYNPWLSLYWLITGKLVGGSPSFLASGRIERVSALRLYSQGSAWFSNEDDRKGTIEVGKFTDLAVLSADYFTIPEEAVKQIESVLTLVGGMVVYGSWEFERLLPSPLPVSPPWSPVAVYGGYPHSHCC